MATLKDINIAIDKKFPNVRIARNNSRGEGGYFYVYSDDNKTSLMLSSLYTTTIPVYRVSALTIGQWLLEVDHILNEHQKPTNTDTIKN